MNFRDYTSVAMLGWFLMMAPLSQDWHPVANLPLQHWYNKSDKPFDSKQDCELDKQRVILHARNASAANDTRPMQIYYQLTLQCISADDPRLKDE